MIENRAALTRSDVGLRPGPLEVLSRRPLCEPPVMRVVTLVSRNVTPIVSRGPQPLLGAQPRCAGVHGSEYTSRMETDAIMGFAYEKGY